MEHIASLIPKVLAKRGLKRQAQASLIVHQASIWISKELPEMKESISVETFHNGTLKISCENSIASQECHQVSDRLKEHLDGVQNIQIIRG